MRTSKYKNIFANGYVPNWSEKVFVITKVKTLLQIFTKKNFKKQVKKSQALKKQYREKAINYMLNWKAAIVLLTAGLIKKAQYKWVNTFWNRNHLEKKRKLKKIYLIMQQKLI